MTSQSNNQLHATLLKKFHALLRQTGQTAYKEAMVAGFGKASSKDLNTDELSALCATLEAKIKTSSKAIADAPKSLRKKRSMCLEVLREMRIWDGKNWNAVNDYVVQKRVAGKLLFECTEDELTELYKKLKVIQGHLNKKQETATELAKWN
jgi:hypothetical protein